MSERRGRRRTEGREVMILKCLSVRQGHLGAQHREMLHHLEHGSQPCARTQGRSPSVMAPRLEPDLARQYRSNSGQTFPISVTHPVQTIFRFFFVPGSHPLLEVQQLLSLSTSVGSLPRPRQRGAGDRRHDEWRSEHLAASRGLRQHVAPAGRKRPAAYYGD